MKNRFFNSFIFAAVVTGLTLTSCSNDDNNNSGNQPDLGNSSRWITLAGALMGTTPGDGNGGTMVYAVSVDDAKNPEKSINAYDDGFHVKSQRTARLQSSEDGATLFNIAYTGPDGGEFSKYTVGGGKKMVQSDVTVNISDYATTSPRWVKLFDGDKTGVAVNLSGVKVTTGAGGTYKHSRGKATVLALHLQNVLINEYKQYEIPLSAEEEILGHYISRLDGPVLNKAGNKLIIGVAKGKHDPATGLAQPSGTYEKISAKSIVVDYPSLDNPTVISSTLSDGNTNGYRSFNNFLAEDGNIYQATQNDTNGSHFLKINASNQYDNTYNFSLDAALGVTGTYIDAWRYVGNGIAYILYTYNNTNQGYVARVDLNTKKAALVTGIPYDADLDFGQYQGFVVNGDEVFIAVTPVGKDGNIYIINSKTNVVTKGAKLVNKAGNHYIGIF